MILASGVYFIIKGFKQRKTYKGIKNNSGEEKKLNENKNQ